jgi:long-chain fatty acid transport protein
MKKIVLMSLVASSVIMASGYKIPETSTNAVALGAANIAHNHENADAAYYNPAKMVFMEDKNNLEVDLTYIGLDKVNYKGTVGGTATNESSESEDFYVPTLHYVSGKLGDNGARVGVSIVAPGGLSKQWKGTQGIKSAEEFSLKIVEINPTAAFQISDNLGFAVGFRIVSSSGVAKATPVAGVIYQDMSGDSVDFGYNLALAYNPTKEIELGVTYRSKVNMNLDGDANLAYPLSTPPLAAGNYAGGVTLPLPAALNLAAAYTFSTQTTLEVVYERTYWSAYKNLDFYYTNPLANAIFGNPKPKDWHDTNTFRVGLTQELDNLTLMAGYVYDETPVPNKTLGFELPDTDSQAVSVGGRYKINESVDVGLSALYSMHESRTISAADANDNGLVGEFSGGDVLIVSAGLGYKF